MGKGERGRGGQSLKTREVEKIGRERDGERQTGREAEREGERERNRESEREK